MARQRTIKPAFFEDEKLGEISPIARLLFIGMWVFADDWGVIKGHPVWLRNNILPYDEIPIEEFEKHLNALIRIGVVMPFVHHEQKFLYIKNFTTHQKVEYPSKTLRNPGPPPEICSISTEKGKSSPSPQRTLTEDSGGSRRTLPESSATSRAEQKRVEENRVEESREERTVGKNELSFENLFSELFFELQRYDKAKSAKAKEKCQATAYDLIEKHTPEYIAEKLKRFRWVMRFKPELAGDKPTGFLIASIKNDYAAPAGYDDWLDQEKKRERTR